jgi:hypothetical protein
MTVETVNGISDLNATYPAGGDPKSEGDNHVRNIKTALKTDLPNITGPVTATQAELNIMDGVTATTAEINILDGVTAATAELNYADGPNTANKFCLLDGSADVPLAQIPNTLTGKDADTVDTYEATSLVTYVKRVSVSDLTAGSETQLLNQTMSGVYSSIIKVGSSSASHSIWWTSNTYRYGTTEDFFSSGRHPEANGGGVTLTAPAVQSTAGRVNIRVKNEGVSTTSGQYIYIVYTLNYNDAT